MGKRSKRDDPQGFHRPFERLADLMPQRRVRIEPLPSAPAPPAPAREPAVSDCEIVARAMEGVAPIDWNCPAGVARCPPLSGQPEEEFAEVARLRGLVDRGEGFVVSDTPEYMEGVGCLAPPQITVRLHRGDFAVQGHVDLHGLTVDAAREVFDDFLRESILAGKRTVLVIHGRGLSSPGRSRAENQGGRVALPQPVAQVGRRVHERPHVRRRLRGKLHPAATPTALTTHAARPKKK